MTATSSPYADAYADYWSAGWRGILPLSHGRKTAPPTGYTGYDALEPSYADCATWADGGPQNIALHLPDGVVGIDVDHYDGKAGGDTLAGLVERLGALPPTYLSTSRDDGISGIRLYRVPSGTVLPTKLPGIEFIQRHHRYVVAWPSLHPTGSTYRWIDERDGRPADGPPALDELPDLPARWIAGLAVEREQATKADITMPQALTVLAEMPTGDPCSHMLRHAGKVMAGGDRHDSYNEATLAVVGAGRRGCPGALTIVKRLQSAFVAEIADRASKSEATAEFARGLHGALAIVAGEPQGNSCPDDVLDWIETLPPATGPTVDQDGVVIEEHTDGEVTPYDQAVRRRYAELKVNEDAKGMLAALKAGEAPPLEALDLGAFLAQPDEEERYRVEGLWPAEGRVMLAAAAKSGKTTMVAANLIPSLVDGVPFLGRFECQPVTGTVVLLNMEVGPRTLRRWMRRSGVANVDRVVVVNLRGRASALSLASEAGRARFGEFLRRLDAEVVILDPLAPVLASLGLDENSNAEVSTFYSWWGEALAQAGVVDDLVVHHTGHGGDRSRGASRLLDEPDAIWTMTRAKESEDGDDPYGDVPMRFLAAYGRDVEMPAESLEFDSDTHRLTLTGLSRRQVSGNEVEQSIRNALKGGISLSRSAICDRAKGNRQAAWDKVMELIDSGDLVTLDKGKSYYFPDAVEVGT